MKQHDKVKVDEKEKVILPPSYWRQRTWRIFSVGDEEFGPSSLPSHTFVLTRALGE